MVSRQEQQPANDGRSQTIPGAGKLGMSLFLAALGMLFAASMVGYLVVRLRAPEWPPAGSPRLPGGLWISTLLLLLSSGTMHRALRAVRMRPESAAGDETATAAGHPRPSLWLWCTFGLGVAFLVSQVLNWMHLVGIQRLPMQSNLYAFTFYMLTGLHGAHILGGLIPLAVTARRAGSRRYHAGSHEGVLYMSMYWHFLDVVWLVMFLVMVVAA